VWCVYAHEGTLSQMRYEISEYPSGLSATSNVSCCVGYAHIHETNLCLWVSFSIQVSLFCIYVGLFWVVRPVDQGVCCRHAAFPHFPLLCTAAFLEGTKARLLAVVNFWAQALNPALLVGKETLYSTTCAFHPLLLRVPATLVPGEQVLTDLVTMQEK
jgi:hypothetical protein